MSADFPLRNSLTSDIEMGSCSPDNGMVTFHIQPMDILYINFQVHTKFLWIKVLAKLWTRGMKFEYVHITKPQGPPPGQLHQCDLSPWEIETRKVFPKGDSLQISPLQTVFPKVNICSVTKTIMFRTCTYN